MKLSLIHTLARVLIMGGLALGILTFFVTRAFGEMGLDALGLMAVEGLCLFAILIGTILLVVDRLDRLAQVARQAEVERLEEKVERLNKLAEGGDWRK